MAAHELLRTPYDPLREMCWCCHPCTSACTFPRHACCSHLVHKTPQNPRQGMPTRSHSSLMPSCTMANGCCQRHPRLCGARMTVHPGHHAHPSHNTAMMPARRKVKRSKPTPRPRLDGNATMLERVHCAVEHSRSQYSEDLILLPTLLAAAGHAAGTFVELGAYDGLTYSNTAMLEVNACARTEARCWRQRRPWLSVVHCLRGPS